MRKKFTQKEDWSVDILFEYSADHLHAAECLFCIQQPDLYIKTLSSAGYLCHLSIELLLKGCWFFEVSYFEDLHDLINIAGKIKFLKLNNEMFRIISNLDKFYRMRYPFGVGDIKEVKYEEGVNLPGEIGDGDWIDTINLIHFIQNQMPSELKNKTKKSFKSFDNAIKEGKYLKKGKLYKRVLMV